MNKLLFDSCIKSQPIGPEHIFITDRKGLYENLMAHGYKTVLFDKDENYFHGADDFIDHMEDVKYQGHALDYIYVPAGTKKQNDRLKEYFETENMKTRDGWKLFYKHDWMDDPEAGDKVAEVVEPFVSNYVQNIEACKLTDDYTEEMAIQLSLSKSLTLQLTEEDKIKSTFFNYCEICEQDNYIKGKILLNLLSERPETVGFFWNTELHTISDYDYYEIRRYISHLYNIQNKEDVRQAVNRTAHKHAYHPIRDYLNGLKYEGKHMIDDLFPKYLGAEKSEYTSAVTELLLSGMIERVFNPGCKFDLCVILADTKQGTGKSTMVRFLALNDDWFSDSLKNLDDDKRAYEQIRSRWCVELGEMVATRRAKDVEGIKSFLSKQFDDYREPYGITPERRLRQCVFIGTTNKPEFLPEDKTGNRRFIPLLCDGDRAVMHPLADESQTRHDIEQCFAEMMEIRRLQGPLPLTVPEEIKADVLMYQEQGTPEDERVGRIQEILETTAGPVCTRKIWDIMNSQDPKTKAWSNYKEPTRYELQDIADIMNLKIVGWRKYTGKDGKSKNHTCRFEDYGRQRAWEREPEIVHSVVHSDVHSVHSDDGFVDVDNVDDLATIPF